MTELAIAKDFRLPVDAVTQKLAFLGRTGSGKTYGATKLAELMLGAGAQIVALDPVGVWYGLRLAANGTEPSDLELPVFGGLHGDIPIEPTSGVLLADLVVDRGISAILDVSQLESDRDKARFAADFANRFFFRKKAAPSAVHLFVEECQEFVPQNPAKGEEQMLHHFHRLIKLGRNFGIGVSLISQRPQEVNKKALNQTELMLAFQMTGPQERKAISLWVSEKGADEDVGDILPKLQVGEAHVWSPQWLQISRAVKIAPKRTFNASSTPTVGGKAVEARPLGAIDLEKLQKAMASTIEKAKETDPKLLRAEVARLKRELATKPATNGHKEKPIDREQIQRLVDVGVRKATETLERDQRQFRQGLKREIDRLQRQFEPIGTTIAALSSAVAAEFNTSERAGEAVVSGVRPGASYMPPRKSPVPVQRAARSNIVPSAESGEVSGTKKRMLDAIAVYESLGESSPSRAAIAGFCGISHTTGTFSTYLSALRTLGLIEDGMNGGIQLTPSGREIASASDIPTLRELHGMWMSKFGGTVGRMLKELLDLYPDGMTRAALGEAVNISHTTGTFSTYLSKLRSLGLLRDISKTEVGATPVLFPEGLA